MGDSESQTIGQQIGTESLGKQLALAGFLCRTVVMQTEPQRGFTRQSGNPAGKVFSIVNINLHKLEPQQGLFQGKQQNVRKLGGSFETREEGSFRSTAANPFLAPIVSALIPNTVFNASSKVKLLKELSFQQS